MLKPTYRATAHTVRKALKALAAITPSDEFFVCFFALLQSIFLTMLIFSLARLLEGVQ